VSRAAYRVLRRDPVMAGLIEAAGPVRLGVRPERAPFEALARAIAHQQLHGAAAERILARFTALSPEATFPPPEQVLATPDAQLRAVGFSYAKVAALKDLACKTQLGLVPAASALATLDDAEIVERLTAVRGVGRWTVEMLLIFQLQRPDVLPVDDFGVRNGFRLAYRLRGMPTPRSLSAFGERWGPHRSVAAWYLWRAVELARAGTLPRCPRAPRVAITRPAKPKSVSKRRRRARP
jgi:DNA-3-methyladenine glycosylase II